MGWNDPKYLVTPKCCEAMEASFAIVLRCELEGGRDDAEGEFGRPYWRLRAAYEHEIFYGHGYGHSLLVGDRFEFAVAHPVCCPFCGRKLPEIRQRPEHKRPRKTAKGTDGYYCATCNERNMNCRCAPPWAGWEPVPSKEPPVMNMPHLSCGRCGRELTPATARMAQAIERRRKGDPDITITTGDERDEKGASYFATHMVTVCEPCEDFYNQKRSKMYNHDDDDQGG